MKKLCFILCIFSLILCACEGQPVKTAEIAETTVQIMAETTKETISVDPVSYGTGWVYLSDADFTAYSDRLDEKQNKELEIYLPILKNEQSFMWQNRWAEKPHSATMTDVYKSFWGDFEDTPRDLMVHGFAMVDITGDGANELILYLNDIGGHYIVLHHNNDGVYGIDFPIRSFFLMENGVYIGSGGAATHWYYTLKFENGQFIENELGSIDEHLNESAETDGGKYVVNGVEVGKEEFYVWEKTVTANDVEYISLTH